MIRLLIALMFGEQFACPECARRAIDRALDLEEKDAAAPLPGPAA